MPLAALASGLQRLSQRYDPNRLDNRNADLIRTFTRHIAPQLRSYFKASVRGLDRIPAGKGMYVANHNGGALMPDAYLFGSALFEERGMADLPFALAHDIVVKSPLQHLFVPLGALRACHDNAKRVCRAGKKLIVYPGGDAEAMRPFADRNRIMFGNRRGYIRLALREDVPVIPVVAHGAHNTAIILDDGKWIVRKLGLDRLLRLNAWPITLSFPWGLTLGPPPAYVPYPATIAIEVLPTIHFERRGDAAARDDDYVERCHQRVVKQMQAALDRLERDAAAARKPWKQLRHWWRQWTAPPLRPLPAAV